MDRLFREGSEFNEFIDNLIINTSNTMDNSSGNKTSDMIKKTRLIDQQKAKLDMIKGADKTKNEIVKGSAKKLDQG